MSSTFITEFYANGINGAERHINETIDLMVNNILEKFVGVNDE